MGISSPTPNRQGLFQLKGMGFDSLPPQENSRRVPAIEPIVQLPVLQNDRHGGAAETANSFRWYQYCSCYRSPTLTEFFKRN